MEPRRRSGRAAALVVPAAAVVAGFLLFMRSRVEPANLPTYVIVSSGDAGVVDLHPGDRFTLDIAPMQQLTGAVAAHAFLMRGDKVWPWDAPQFMVDKDGTLHVHGTVDALFRGFPAGDWEIAVAVGRPDSLPNEPRYVLGARDNDGGSASWMLVTERVRLGS